MAHTDVHPNTFRANSHGWPTSYWIDCHEDGEEFSAVSIHLSVTPEVIEARLCALEAAIADVRTMLPKEVAA